MTMTLTLKAARVNAGLTQAQAAKKLGVSKYTVSNYERGLTHPTVEIANRMEIVYGIPYDQLIFLPMESA